MSQIASLSTRVAPEHALPKFYLGRVLMTCGVDAHVQAQRFDPMHLLRRHVCGDWGDLCPEDKALNNLSVKDGGRLMSVYCIDSTLTIWVVTEAGRSVTTLLLPSEY